MAMSSDCAVDVDAVGVSMAALAQRWTDAIAFRANFPCQTSNMTLRRIGARLACRIGAVACQKRREWGLIAGGDLGLFAYLEFSKSLSPGVLRKHRLRAALLFLHQGPELRMADPIVAFSANSGSIVCNEAPLWHFLPTSFAECFR